MQRKTRQGSASNNEGLQLLYNKKVKHSKRTKIYQVQAENKKTVRDRFAELFGSKEDFRIDVDKVVQDIKSADKIVPKELGV